MWLNPNPLFHTSGSGFMSLGPLQLGATQVLCRFEPALVLELIESERASVLGAAATMADILIDHPAIGTHGVSSLHVVTIGAMPVPPELVRRAELAFGAPVAVGYGLTEACGLTHCVRPDDPHEVRVGTVGRPLPVLEARIGDRRSGRAVPEGEAGEVLVSGRISEMIIRGAEKVYPAEIEAVLAAHPSVAAVAVLGMPDPTYGEVVGAAVQLRPGAGADRRELKDSANAT